MVRLILGRAGTGKTARVFEEIRGLVARQSGGVVLLVPEQYSHEAERELCAAAGDSLSLYAEVLSFTGLARKVFAECGGARPVMDEGGRLLCMAVAAEQCAGALKLYGRCRRDPRLLGGLLAAADELRRAGATPDGMLRAAAASGGILAEKLHDLAIMTEAFAAVEERSAADPAQVLETLAALLSDSLSARGRFYVDGFSDFTAPERDVLRALIAAGAELTVCLTCSGEADDEVFALPLATARWLSRTARDCGRDCAEEWADAPAASDPIRFLCEHLFSFGAAEPPAVNGEVTLLTAPDIFSECELAAAQMSLLARKGCRWRDMAVAVRGFGDYRTALECACETYGVPVFLTGRGDMLRLSVPTLLLSALETVLHGWEYDAVFSCLKTGLAGAEPAQLDELENYCVLWNIRGSQWNRDFTLHPEGYNREFDAAANEKLAALNALRRKLAAPLTALEAALKAARTAREHAGALCGFCADIDLPRTLQTRARALRATRPEAAAQTERLWDIICGALEQFAGVLGDMPMDPEQFTALLRLMLSKYDIGLIPVSLDRVQAGELDAMRRRQVKHLFLLGSSDTRLPAPAADAGLFSDEERQELSELGLSLGGAREELSRELGALYNCLSLPSDSLTVSRPLADADGDETRPSVVTERAAALLGLEERPGSLLSARTLAQASVRGLAVLAGAGSREPLCLAARQVFENRGEGAELARLSRAAVQERGRLSEQSVLALYGRRPRLSATRAERFNTCRFSYFLQFGLKAKPRQSAVFDPRDYGTFMHYALEHVAREAMARGGFSKVSRAEIETLADAALDEYVRTRLNDFAEKTPRFIYLFKRLRETVKQVCADMWEELRASDFQPLELELDLTAPGVLTHAPDDDGLRVTGRVDRVDGWVRGDVLYIRVTDYKTGVKKFSLSDVCQGMELQMLLYLFTLQNRGAAHFGAKKLAPAGVLYVPARFETVHADGPLSEEELAQRRGSGTRRSGLVLADDEVLEAMEPGENKRFIPVKFKKDGSVTGDALATAERFGALERYVEKTIAALAEQLRAGSVQADPWFKSARSNACAFCDYRQACLFDEGADCLRVLTGLKTAEAWERIEAGEVPV